jgi:hypothetical protein
MPIRPSAAAEIRQLVDALGATENVKREAAIARLAVLGPRAVDHLLRVYPTTAALETRLGILRALESSADARVGALAAATLSDPSPPLVSAAISVLRSLLGSADSKTARDALDALVAVVVDRSRQTDCRLAAFDALRELPSSTLDPIRRTLSADPDAELRQRVGHAPAVVAENPDASVWTTAVEGRLPSSPELLKTALGREASAAKLIHLQRLVDQVRAQESREGDAGRREAWRVVRGALHQVLASRGSRLALYDLRDSLLETERLPVAFLAALEEIGDATCLEPLAAAYDASAAGADPWWRDHLATAFRAIVHREGLTRRHAAVKRLTTRWPAATADLMART